MEYLSSTVLFSVFGVIVCLRGLIFGIVRTVASLILAHLDGRPVRLDIPIPGFPIDLVNVTDLNQIAMLNHHPGIGRVHSFETDKLPPWVQFFFKTTRFLSLVDGSWFLPFENNTSKSGYAARRQIIVDALSKSPHTQDDVKKASPCLIMHYVATILRL